MKNQPEIRICGTNLKSYSMTTFSKTAAIRKARRHVSIHGRGTSWQIISPFYADNLAGPTTTASASSYFEAQARARSIKARIALSLMGRFDEHADYAIYNHGPATFPELVEIGLKAYRGGQE